MKIILIIAAALLLSACAPSETPQTCDVQTYNIIEKILAGMSLEQKIGQMFFAAFRRDADGAGITSVCENIAGAIARYHVGGIILFAENIADERQVTEYIADLQRASSLPLLIGTDEEGGRVTRTGALDLPRAGSALSIGETRDARLAYNTALTIAGYLRPLGFNVNFAPVADIWSNPDNAVISDRAFASDAYTAAMMVCAFTQGSLSGGVMPTLKHFPGHGGTLQDSHFGAAVSYGTLEEFKSRELLPFQAGINAGAPFVMSAHISTPNITGCSSPALFSSFWLQDILRGELGFEGLIISDALDMQAVTRYHNACEAAVLAILAGVDMLLMPACLSQAFAGVLEAVASGMISEARIRESTRRILAAKLGAGLIS